MPKKWGPGEHEELLKHILSTHKIDYNLISKTYGSGGPTAGALTQHVDKWMKSMGAKSKAGGTPVKAAVTPRKTWITNSTSTPATNKTPTAHTTPNSNKKRRFESMSEDDESEADINGDVPARMSLPRRSKSAASSSPAMRAALADDDEEDESDTKQGDCVQDAGDEASGGTDKIQSRFDSVMDRKFDSDSESDISDFERTLL